MHRVSLALILLALPACGTPEPDAPPDAFTCEANAAPLAPMVMSPVSARIDIIPDELAIELSPFFDRDVGDVQGATEVEIYSIDNGVPVSRIWSALIESEPAAPITLADGTFVVGMTEWTDYVIRARHRDARGDCSEWSPWSENLPFRTDDGSTYLYDPDVVRDVYLTIPPASWTAIDAQATPPGCVPYERDYHTATLTYDGEVLEGVGIHVKGGCGSARHLDGKSSFKVKFDWDDPAIPGCPENRRFRGQKHLVLNNNVQDRTMQHERMGYELEQMLGVPTPRANSVRVHVNGAYWGLYTNVEPVDRRMMERWFGSNGGMAYEGTYWCDLVAGNVPPLSDPDTNDEGCLTREFRTDTCGSPPGEGDDPETYAPLRRFIALMVAIPLGEFYPAITQYVEFDTFLSQWAIESVLSHWDAYQFSIMNNYRVYHDPTTDKWTVIPTGIDQTFLGDQDPWGVSGTLAARCIDEPDCDAAFGARLAEVNAMFTSANLAARAQQIHDQINADVLADPRKEYDNAEFAQAYVDLQSYIVDRPARVTQHLTAHGF